MISAIRIIADIIFSYPSLFPNLSNKYSILKAFISIRQKKPVKISLAIKEIIDIAYNNNRVNISSF